MRDHCHFTYKCRAAVLSMCNLRINMPNKIPVVFHVSSYVYHLIIKELIKSLRTPLNVLGKHRNVENVFFVLLEKETRKVDKDNNEDIITISYKKDLLIVQDLWQFHDQILPIKSQKGITKSNGNIATVFLNMRVKDYLIKYKCLPCNKG